MKLDTYHRYAAFFDAARALPGWHYLRVNGDEAGEAYRAWAANHGLEIVEERLTRTEGDRTVEWGTLESPGVSVGVHLDDRACGNSEAPPMEPVEPEHEPAPQPIEPEIAF